MEAEVIRKVRIRKLKLVLPPHTSEHDPASLYTQRKGICTPKKNSSAIKNSKWRKLHFCAKKSLLVYFSFISGD